MEETKAGRADKEYVIQHFGTDPSFLIEDICEDFKDVVTSSMAGIKVGLYCVASSMAGIKGGFQGCCVLQYGRHQGIKAPNRTKEWFPLRRAL